jgi:hypothetical protein
MESAPRRLHFRSFRGASISAIGVKSLHAKLGALALENERQRVLDQPMRIWVMVDIHH